VLALVVLVVAGVGILAAVRGTSASSAPSAPSALVAAPDAESSAWYCTGQTTGSGGAPGFLVLTNATARQVAGTITAVSDSGATERTPVTVPARAAVAPSIPSLSSGSWESETVTLSGGGVAVTQVVHGPAGWSEAPCQSTTASVWYFPGGTTGSGDPLYLSLLNPTSTPVVVDVSFTTPSGAVHPINFQGIVLQAGQVEMENVSSEVQNVSTVSTVVATRTGRVVASELQQFLGSPGGLAIVPGAAHLRSSWFIPQAQEVANGSTQIDVFNPASSPESVTVRLRLPSGPLAPLSRTVAAGTTWALETNAQTRIPDGMSYSAEIEATGGPGVVVGRTVALSPTAPSPQAGLALAVDDLSTASPTGEWVVPPPGTTADPAVSGAAPASLALSNTSGTLERYRVEAGSSSRARLVASGVLAAGTTIVASGSPLGAAGLEPIVVTASGPLAVSEDVAPSGGVGVVTMPGLPLAAPIGS
jgi:hypothetical protein